MKSNAPLLFDSFSFFSTQHLLFCPPKLSLVAHLARNVSLCQPWTLCILSVSSTVQRIQTVVTWPAQWRRRGCFMYIWIAATFVWTVGSVSVLMTQMFTWTDYQGLEQVYLNIMPLKTRHSFYLYWRFWFLVLELVFLFYSFHLLLL